MIFTLFHKVSPFLYLLRSKCYIIVVLFNHYLAFLYSIFSYIIFICIIILLSFLYFAFLYNLLGFVRLLTALGLIIIYYIFIYFIFIYLIFISSIFFTRLRMFNIYVPFFIFYILSPFFKFQVYIIYLFKFASLTFPFNSLLAFYFVIIRILVSNYFYF